MQIRISLFFLFFWDALGCGFSPAFPCTKAPQTARREWFFTGNQTIKWIKWHLSSSSSDLQLARHGPSVPEHLSHPRTALKNVTVATHPPCGALLLVSPRVLCPHQSSLRCPDSSKAWGVEQGCLGAGCSFPLSTSIQPWRSNHFTGANKGWIKLEIWRTHLKRAPKPLSKSSVSSIRSWQIAPTDLGQCIIGRNNRNDVKNITQNLPLLVQGDLNHQLCFYLKSLGHGCVNLHPHVWDLAQQGRFYSRVLF